MDLKASRCALCALVLVILQLSSTVAFQSTCTEKACEDVRNEIPGNDIVIDVPWALKQHSEFSIADKRMISLMNDQINLELQISYIYLSLANFFDRDDVALPGFKAFFKDYSSDEMGHAYQMMEFMNKRGVSAALGPLLAPCEPQLLLTVPESSPASNAVPFDNCGNVKATVTRTSHSGNYEKSGEVHVCNWKNPLQAVVAVRQAELNNHKHLKKVHAHASKINDPVLIDFIDVHLKEQVDEVKELSDLLTQLQRVESCLGYYLIDKDLQKKMEKVDATKHSH